MVKKILAILLGLLIIIGICVVNARYINTNQLYVREEIIYTSKLDENSNDILIAYFSDLHYGGLINNSFLDKAINTINNFDPDIIIFGGDLVDDFSTKGISVDNREYIINSLKSLESKYGKYAIYGEDDANEDILNIYNESGFKLLDNTNVSININNNIINVVGINSLPEKVGGYLDSFNGINPINYTFVVAHHPDTFKTVITNDFDYMLAGHTHGGQVYFPIFSLFNREWGCEEYYKGKTKKNNKTLDITNGVGRKDTNARFLADAEIVMYRLSPTKQQKTN